MAPASVRPSLIVVELVLLVVEWLVLASVPTAKKYPDLQSLSLYIGLGDLGAQAYSGVQAVTLSIFGLSLVAFTGLGYQPISLRRWLRYQRAKWKIRLISFLLRQLTNERR